jgi:hypothetical protein
VDQGPLFGHDRRSKGREGVEALLTEDVFLPSIRRNVVSALADDKIQLQLRSQVVG